MEVCAAQLPRVNAMFDYVEARDRWAESVCKVVPPSCPPTWRCASMRICICRGTEQGCRCGAGAMLVCCAVATEQGAGASMHNRR